VSSKNRVDSFFGKVKNHPVLSVVVIVAVCVSGLASFTESLSTVLSFFRPEPTPITSTPAPEALATSDNDLDGEYHLWLMQHTNTGCLFFNWDSSVVATLPEPAATNQTIMLSNLDNSAAVRIIGFGDRGASSQYALGVGERRANAIQALLTSEYGFNPRQIETQSRGLENTPQVADFLCGARVEQIGQ